MGCGASGAIGEVAGGFGLGGPDLRHPGAIVQVVVDVGVILGGGAGTGCRIAMRRYLRFVSRNPQPSTLTPPASPLGQRGREVFAVCVLFWRSGSRESR